MKVLIIEDENGLRDAIMETLKQEGYLVDGTADGESGLDLIRSGLYDLVILDIMLPGLNGLDVLSIARKLKINVPVILLTALSQLQNKIDGMDSGADDYITKPFEMRELLARIRMVMRRQGPQELCTSQSLHAGDLVLDASSFLLCCSCGSRNVRLAKKEFYMMEYLMRNPGQVLTREQITMRVWGYESDAEYNNVDVYISYLRKKMQFVGTSMRILAVRGVGYKLEEPADD